MVRKLSSKKCNTFNFAKVATDILYNLKCWCTFECHCQIVFQKTLHIDDHNQVEASLFEHSIAKGWERYLGYWRLRSANFSVKYVIIFSWTSLNNLKNSPFFVFTLIIPILNCVFCQIKYCVLVASGCWQLHHKNITIK